MCELQQNGNHCADMVQIPQDGSNLNSADKVTKSFLVGLPKVFEDSKEDFEQLLHTDFPDTASTSTAVSSSADDVCDLQVRTLGGTLLSLGSLPIDMSLSKLQIRIANLLGAPAFTLKLLVDTKELSCSVEQTIRNAGLTVPGVSVTVLRYEADRSKWASLFSAFIRAIEQKRVSDAKDLIDQGAGFDSQGNILKATHRMHLPDDMTARVGEAGNTMLHLAIRERLVDLAMYLIARGVDLEATNDVNRSPLVQAVVTRQEAVVEVLLTAKVSVHTPDYLGNTALTYAVQQGNDKLSAQLLLAGIHCLDIVGTGQSWYEHAFIGAAPVFRGSVIKATTSPVMYGCIGRMPLTVLALLDLGAPIVSADVHGRTALHYAYEHAMPDVVDTLLRHGADATMPDQFGWLPHDGVRQPLDTTRSLAKRSVLHRCLPGNMYGDFKQIG